MGIPKDPLERRKSMLKLWREDYGARFSVFDLEDQPAPELEIWNSEMWGRMIPSRIHKGITVPQ